MAVTFTREFYINFGLFLFACVALALSIWAFLKSCKDSFGDSFRNIDNDSPDVDKKASTIIKLPLNKYGTVNFATGGGSSSKRPSQNEKENAQSFLYLVGDCLQCTQYKKGSLTNFYYDKSFNDSIYDPENKLPTNNLINIGLEDAYEYTSDLPCDTLTRLRKQECNV